MDPTGLIVNAGIWSTYSSTVTVSVYKSVFKKFWNAGILNSREMKYFQKAGVCRTVIDITKIVCNIE